MLPRYFCLMGGQARPRPRAQRLSHIDNGQEAARLEAGGSVEHAGGRYDLVQVTAAFTMGPADWPRRCARARGGSGPAQGGLSAVRGRASQLAVSQRRQLRALPRSAPRDELGQRDALAFAPSSAQDSTSPQGSTTIAVAEGAAAVLVRAALRRRDDVALVLDRAGAQQQLPVRQPVV